MTTPPVVWMYQRQNGGNWSKLHLLQGDPVYVDDCDNPIAVDEHGFLSSYEHDGDWNYMHDCQLRKHKFVLKQEEKQEEKQTKQDIKSRIEELLNEHANAQRELFRICTNDLEEKLFQLARPRKPVFRSGSYQICISFSEIESLSQFKPTDELVKRLEVWAKQHSIAFECNYFLFTNSKF